MNAIVPCPVCGAMQEFERDPRTPDPKTGVAYHPICRKCCGLEGTVTGTFFREEGEYECPQCSKPVKEGYEFKSIRCWCCVDCARKLSEQV